MTIRQAITSMSFSTCIFSITVSPEFRYKSCVLSQICVHIDYKKQLAHRSHKNNNKLWSKKHHSIQVPFFFLSYVLFSAVYRFMQVYFSLENRASSHSYICLFPRVSCFSLFVCCWPLPSHGPRAPIRILCYRWSRIACICWVFFFFSRRSILAAATTVFTVVVVSTVSATPRDTADQWHRPRWRITNNKKHACQRASYRVPAT